MRAARAPAETHPFPSRFSFSFKTLFTLALVAAALAGCIVTGPKTENKSALSVLNGENYNTAGEASIAGVGLYVVEAKERPTTITGRVVLANDEQDKSIIPNLGLSHVRIRLFPYRPTENRTETATAARAASDAAAVSPSPLATTTTDATGEFKLVTPIKNGRYVLELDHKKYRASTEVDVKSYVIENVILIARSSASPKK